MLQNFKEEFKKNMERNNAALKDPNSPAAKDTNLKIGLAGILLGLVGALVSAVAYAFTGRIFIWVAAVTIAGFAVGIKMTITGRR